VLLSRWLPGLWAETPIGTIVVRQRGAFGGNPGRDVVTQPRQMQSQTCNMFAGSCAELVGTYRGLTAISPLFLGMVVGWRVSAIVWH
jgi:hypothetical protein